MTDRRVKESDYSDGEEKNNEVRRIHRSRNAEWPMTNQRQMTKGRDSLDHYIVTSDLRLIVQRFEWRSMITRFRFGILALVWLVTAPAVP